MGNLDQVAYFKSQSFESKIDKCGTNLFNYDSNIKQQMAFGFVVF